MPERSQLVVKKIVGAERVLAATTERGSYILGDEFLRIANTFRSPIAKLVSKRREIEKIVQSI